MSLKNLFPMEQLEGRTLYSTAFLLDGVLSVNAGEQDVFVYRMPAPDQDSWLTTVSIGFAAFQESHSGQFSAVRIAGTGAQYSTDDAPAVSQTDEISESGEQISAKLRLNFWTSESTTIENDLANAAE